MAWWIFTYVYTQFTTTQIEIQRNKNVHERFIVCVDLRGGGFFQKLKFQVHLRFCYSELKKIQSPGITSRIRSLFKLFSFSYSPTNLCPLLDLWKKMISFTREMKLRRTLGNRKLQNINKALNVPRSNFVSQNFCLCLPSYDWHS